MRPNPELDAKTIVVGTRVMISGDDVDDAFQEAIGVVRLIDEDATIYVQLPTGHIYPAQIWELEPC